MNYLRLITRSCSNVAAKQEEPKVGLLKRIGSYVRMVLEDYKMVAVETGQDIKEHPIKASFYFALIGASGYLIKTNPSEESFRVQMLQNSHELMLIGEPIRNPQSDTFVQRLNWCYNEGRAKRLNLGICSLIWEDKFANEVDLYESQCKPLKIGWLDVKDHVLDIGIAGHWLWSEKAMVDYDINPTEWPQEEKQEKQS